jgi:hypothetical protein
VEWTFNAVVGPSFMSFSIARPSSPYGLSIAIDWELCTADFTVGFGYSYSNRVRVDIQNKKA